MAESYEMLLDVKLDLKDVKTDNCLKNWVNWMKCHVKIDAIECFPCYLKVSFYHEDDANREYPFSIIRLNIPGVRVGSAASRTKSFTYGVFWKNNRKRCRLFLAFQDKQSCSTHMKWLKRAINSLEFYRKDILENHRVSRSIVNTVKPADEDESPLDISKNSLNDTQTERDMNDILGPLPEIPTTNGDCCNRLSTRRSSGCSGIYEEILDPADGSFKREQDSRGSIVSGIYVDMTTPLKLHTSTEMPPPLPPRRHILNHVYTSIDMQAVESSGKSRKSTWNLKNVFGRTKGVVDALKTPKASEVVKSQTSAAISNLCSNHCQFNLLTKNSKNSFSTPDLTNIAACSPVTPAAAAPNVTNELDETDLDIMDIERSNSLNCPTNQFTCRPPPFNTLNISDNILWSHNLSLTLSSTCNNASAINLVGANVNGRDSILERDISGYCKMAPIFNKKNQHQLVRTSTKNFDDSDNNQSAGKPNQSLDSSTIYCTMAPIMPKTDVPVQQPNQEYVEQNPMKHITFERTFEMDEVRPSTLDCSMESVEHLTDACFSDITSSSGISSLSGNNEVDMNGRCNNATPADVTTIKAATTPTAPAAFTATANDRRNSDDAISLTYTETPPQSARANQYFNENPFIYHSSKFDERTPSYFPNKITTNDRLNTSIDSVLKTAKEFHMASATVTSSNGLIRSWTRFRKIDFSPLKIRINSMWQRSNQGY